MRGSEIGRRRADVAPQRPRGRNPEQAEAPIRGQIPRNGMMISDGSGTQADSRAINAARPRYPKYEITETIAAAMEARTLLNTGRRAAASRFEWVQTLQLQRSSQ